MPLAGPLTTINFGGVSDSMLTIEVDMNRVNGSLNVAVDNIQFAQIAAPAGGGAIPEPSTLVLSLLGLLGFGWFSWPKVRKLSTRRLAKKSVGAWPWMPGARRLESGPLVTEAEYRPKKD